MCADALKGRIVVVAVPVERRTYLPEEAVAGDFGEIVSTLTRSDERAAIPCLVVDGEEVALRPEVAAVLLQVAEAMRQGMAVTVAPQAMRLTTQEAAELLGVSRSTLVRMLDAGEIPFERVRRHRRLYLADVLEYQRRQRRDAREALSDMVSDAQAMGDYDLDPDEVRQALAGVRSEG